MIDYIKIIDLKIGSDIRSRLLFESILIEPTGEILANKKSNAYYQNMIFTLTPGDRFAKMGGSLHKFSNGGEFNNDRFTFEKFRQVHEDLSRFISPDDVINVLEFGINIVTPFDPSNFIKNLISHKQAQFNKVFSAGMAYSQVMYSNYGIKIYNKGLQQPTGSYILRVEVKYLKMQKLFPNGLKWANLGDLETWEYLGKVLKDKFSEVVYYDPSIELDQVPEKERQIIEKGHNPIYWQNLLTPHASRERKQFQSLIKKHGSKFNSISELMDQEVSALVKSSRFSVETKREDGLSELVKSSHYSAQKDLTSKGTDSEDLVKSSPLLYSINSPTKVITTIERLCQVTGIIISMQKSESKFLNVSGIKFLNANDHSAFKNLKSKRLSANWEDEPLEVQYREIAHSIRNEYYNPRHNATRDINKLYSYPLLFDIEPFIRPEKMVLAGQI